MAQTEKEGQKTKEKNWHSYEHNPVPWWIVLMWIGFFIFGIVYLIKNLL